MTSLFSKPRAFISPFSDFKTYRPVIGKLHVATFTFLLFLIATAVVVTSSLWLKKTAKPFDRPTISATKPVLEAEPKLPQETGISVNCTSFLNQNRSGSCPVTPQTSYDNNLTESNRSCPDYFKWIHEDLKPWRETGITKEMVERAKTTAHFRLVIVNGKVFVENYKKSIQTRDVFTQWGIIQLLRRYPGKLPDVDLMFDCDDRPVIRSDGYKKGSNLTAVDELPALFRYCGDRWTADIVFPDWSFWGWYVAQILFPFLFEANVYGC